MEPTLTVGNAIYKHGQKIKYQGLNGYQNHLQGKRIDLNDRNVTGLNPEYPAILEYSKGNWMTKPEWFIRTSNNKFGLNSVNVLNDNPYVEGKYNIQLVDPVKQANELKEAEESKQRKAAEEQQRIAKEDQEAETNVTPIPCSQTPINLKDRVIYDSKEGIVTGFEITYPDQTTQTVRCDEKLLSITAGIQKNKSDLFTKRNPGVVYAHVVAGKRSRRRKNRYGKKR